MWHAGPHSLGIRRRRCEKSKAYRRKFITDQVDIANKEPSDETVL